MLYFPQLSTGAVGQYPIQKRRLTRTVVNEAFDGARFKLACPEACRPRIVAREALIRFRDARCARCG